MMLDRRLLSQGEIKWLMAKGDNHCQIVSAWAIQLIRTEVEARARPPRLRSCGAVSRLGRARPCRAGECLAPQAVLAWRPRLTR